MDIGQIQKDLLLFILVFFGTLILLPTPDGAVRFTKFPPSVLFVSNGGTARFVWDYHVDNKATYFSTASPVWFYETLQSAIGADISSDGWKWNISSITCPPRYLNPTQRVSKELKATLVITNVIAADNGTYGCSLILKNGTQITSTSRLFITVPPQFNPQPPLTMSIAEGHDFNLPCTAIGSPTPNITWVQIVGNNIVIKSTGTGSATLSIQNIRRDQNGAYECQAKNNINENPVVKQTVITVYYKPVIDKSDSSSALSSWNDKSVRLICFATGLPAPRISWYKPTNQQITTGVDIVPGGSEVTVTTTLDQGDYGQYKCRATNIAGSDEHAINVTQLFVPGPANVSVTDIEASSFTVRWKEPAYDGGNPVTGYLLVINTKQPIITVNTYALITGLKKNTRYTVKVYAKNKVGYGMESTKIITTKKQGKPSAPVLSATLFQTAGSRLSVILKWTKPDANGGMITRYTINIKDMTLKSNWTKIKDILDQANLEYTITKSIEYGKTYKFIVTAWNKYGESVKDNWKAKTVNTTADKATYTSDNVVRCSTEKETKYIIGVITAILVMSIGLNILLSVLFWRKLKLNRRKEKKGTQIRKPQQKATKEEIYDNDLELEDNALPAITASSAQQPSNPVPEYETIQELNEQTSPQETPRMSHDPSHYKRLNLQSNISTQEGKRTMYEPLSATSKEPKTQQDANKQHPYKPLGLNSQSSDYQSLHTNSRESVI